MITKIENQTFVLWNGPTSYGPAGTERPARPWFDGDWPEHVRATIRTGRSQGWVGPRNESYEQFDSYMVFSGLRPGDTFSRHGRCGLAHYRVRGSKGGLFVEAA
jgi:hypothetical protein